MPQRIRDAMELRENGEQVTQFLEFRGKVKVNLSKENGMYGGILRKLLKVKENVCFEEKSKIVREKLKI